MEQSANTPTTHLRARFTHSLDVTLFFFVAKIVIVPWILTTNIVQFKSTLSVRYFIFKLCQKYRTIPHKFYIRNVEFKFTWLIRHELFEIFRSKKYRFELFELFCSEVVVTMNCKKVSRKSDKKQTKLSILFVQHVFQREKSHKL